MLIEHPLCAKDHSGYQGSEGEQDQRVPVLRVLTFQERLPAGFSEPGHPPGAQASSAYPPDSSSTALT